MRITWMRRADPYLFLVRSAVRIKDRTEVKTKKPSIQAALDKKHREQQALGPDNGYDQQDRVRVHGARAPPGVRLLDKAEILEITGVTFPTIWTWMRAGTFPRSRIVGGKSMWRSDEIEAWLAGLPLRPLKGDAPSDQKIEEPEPA
jgi:predicted DNA-binding transcriptional regulator AlpA